MDDLYICENFMCSVYVYGASSPSCPGCDSEGKKMPSTHAEEFTFIYRDVQQAQPI